MKSFDETEDPSAHQIKYGDQGIQKNPNSRIDKWNKQFDKWMCEDGPMPGAHPIRRHIWNTQRDFFVNNLGAE